MTRPTPLSVSFADPEDIMRAETLSRQAYARLRRAIRTGDFVPGLLYSEFEVAKLLEISRTPVREALIELAREGLIEKVPQRGFRLRQLSNSEIEEAFDLRALIEAYVVKRVAADASEDDLALLDEVLDRQQQASSDPTAFLEIDEEFHLAMPQLVGLQRCRTMLRTLRTAVWELAGTDTLHDPDRVAQVLAEHRAILESVAARDADGAADAIIAHIYRSAAARRAGHRAPPPKVAAPRGDEWRLETEAGHRHDR